MELPGKTFGWEGSEVCWKEKDELALLYKDSKVLLLISPPNRSVWLLRILETLAFHWCTLVFV